MAKKFSIGQTVTDISGAKGKVVAVDSARGKIGIRVTEAGTNSHMREGHEYTVPISQVK